MRLLVVWFVWYVYGCIIQNFLMGFLKWTISKHAHVRNKFVDKSSHSVRHTLRKFKELLDCCYYSDTIDILIILTLATPTNFVLKETGSRSPIFLSRWHSTDWFSDNIKTPSILENYNNLTRKYETCLIDRAQIFLENNSYGNRMI